MAKPIQREVDTRQRVDALPRDFVQLHVVHAESQAATHLFGKDDVRRFIVQAKAVVYINVLSSTFSVVARVGRTFILQR